MKSQLISDVGNIILNLIYPPTCCFCGIRLSPLSRTFVCDECANSLLYCRMTNRCKHCGKPLSEGDLCMHCASGKSNLAALTAPFIYSGRARLGIIAFKKESHAENAKTFSIYVAEMVKYDFGDVKFDCVISAPPRSGRMRTQDYDQAALLAKHTARRLCIPYYKNVLRQNGDIQKQSSLSTEERLENVRGRFSALTPERIKDKTILVIDDVCTTGATFEECARALKQAGAQRIYAASAATTALLSENK